ncbi:olfactory receptor 6N2-like [Hemicordylus capensis]|uniref:olfactory receptor 6N2-like n=1 Tax=Hemicordylus capensis TaxID=884348 RepID=UPI0023020D44|nr:olfactory receptor 6N2-like [Hemicordylus capensis]
METSNQTKVTKFILVGFPNLQQFQKLLFLLLLVVYLFTIFFVSILSFLEVWYMATTIPKMLSNLLTERKSISFSGCLLQTYFFHSLGATECYLLAAMAYDRYLAICNPLRYPSIMTSRMCAQLAAGCWICGFMCPITEVILVSKLPFCGPNQIEHLFCDFPPLLSLACTETSVNILDFVINTFIILVTFLLITSSYVKIIQSILRIRTTEGRKKAFSTCASHLVVVLLFFGCIVFMYVWLKKSYSLNYDRAFTVIYSVFTPLANPVIYSLRKKEILKAIKRRIQVKSDVN